MKAVVTRLVSLALVALVSVPLFALGGVRVATGDVNGISMGQPVKDWIDASSWSTPDAPGAAALTKVGPGTLVLSNANSPSWALELCRSQKVVPSLLLEERGQKMQFLNATFRQCPAEGTQGTFMIDFRERKNLSRAAAPELKPNAVITGLGAAPVRAHVKALAVRGNELVFDLVLPAGVTIARGQMIPELSIDSNGKKATFMKVTLSDILISSIASEPPKQGLLLPAVQKVRCAFDAFVGDPTGLAVALGQ